jgi:integrase
MGRRVKGEPLETREGRKSLPKRKKPYYRLIGTGLHLGYYKGDRGGRWSARRYLGNQKYEECSLAAADDEKDSANGDTFLTFEQAQEKARAWKKSRDRDQIAPSEYTVNEALDDYFEQQDADGKKTRDARQRADFYIRSTFGRKRVLELSAPEIRKWHRKIANTLPRLRSTVINGAKFADVDIDDPDVKRARQSSANRVLTILKAALNRAWENEIVEHNDAWRKVKAFKNTDAPREGYLSRKECRRLANIADPDFRKLIWAALFTGARYGELVRLQVKDYNPDVGTIHIRKSKSGKERHVILNDEGVAFFGEVTAGRGRNETMLLRDDGGEWKESMQIRRMNDARAIAKIDTPISFHSLRHTYASWSVMGGMPLMVVARNLGHADTRMVEKHYGHLASEYMATETKKAAPKFGYKPEGRVQRIDATG